MSTLLTNIILPFNEGNFKLVEIYDRTFRVTLLRFYYSFFGLHSNNNDNKQTNKQPNKNSKLMH